MGCTDPRLWEGTDKPPHQCSRVHKENEVDARGTGGRGGGRIGTLTMMEEMDPKIPSHLYQSVSVSVSVVVAGNV